MSSVASHWRRSRPAHISDLKKAHHHHVFSCHHDGLLQEVLSRCTYEPSSGWYRGFLFINAPRAWPYCLPRLDEVRLTTALPPDLHTVVSTTTTKLMTLLIRSARDDLITTACKTHHARPRPPYYNRCITTVVYPDPRRSAALLPPRFTPGATGSRLSSTPATSGPSPPGTTSRCPARAVRHSAIIAAARHPRTRLATPAASLGGAAGCPRSLRRRPRMAGLLSALLLNAS